MVDSIRQVRGIGGNKSLLTDRVSNTANGRIVVYAYIRLLLQIRCLIDEEFTAIVFALSLSSADQCNSACFLSVSLQSTTEPLQRVQNASVYVCISIWSCVTIASKHSAEANTLLDDEGLCSIKALLASEPNYAQRLTNTKTRLTWFESSN